MNPRHDNRRFFYLVNVYTDAMNVEYGLSGYPNKNQLNLLLRFSNKIKHKLGNKQIR